MSPAERTEAGKRIEVSSSNISTVEFKELGETARFRLLGGFISKVWNETCDVARATLTDYAPSGASQWRVKCQGGTNFYDYSVAIPERKTNPVRVLQCHTPRPNVTECSILGRPKKDGE